jgi:hypothetical protein
MILKAHSTCFYSDTGRKLSGETAFVIRTAPGAVSTGLSSASCGTRVLSRKRMKRTLEFWPRVDSEQILLTHPNSMLFKYKTLLIVECLLARDQVIVNVTAAPMILTETDVAELCAAGRR